MTSQTDVAEVRQDDRPRDQEGSATKAWPLRKKAVAAPRRNYKTKAFDAGEVFASGGAWTGSEGHWSNAIFDLRSSFGGLAIRREGARWRDWLVWPELKRPRHKACELYFDLKVADEQALYMLGLCDPALKEGPAFAYDLMAIGAYVCHGQSFSDYQHGKAHHRVNLQIPAGARQHWRWVIDADGGLRRASLALDNQDPIIWTPNSAVTAKTLSPCLAIAYTAAPLELSGLGFECAAA